MTLIRRREEEEEEGRREKLLDNLRTITLVDIAFRPLSLHLIPERSIVGAFVRASFAQKHRSDDHDLTED